MGAHRAEGDNRKRQSRRRRKDFLIRTKLGWIYRCAALGFFNVVVLLSACICVAALVHRRERNIVSAPAANHRVSRLFASRLIPTRVSLRAKSFEKNVYNGQDSERYDVRGAGRGGMRRGAFGQQQQHQQQRGAGIRPGRLPISSKYTYKKNKKKEGRNNKYDLQNQSQQHKQQLGNGNWQRQKRKGGKNNNNNNNSSNRTPLSELPPHDLLKIHTAQIKKAKSRGEWQHALRAYEWLLSWGVSPDKFVYNALMTALANTNPNRALGIYNEMVEASFTPDATSANAIIAAKGRLGQWQSALQFFRQFLAKESAEINPLSGTFEGVRDYNDFSASPLEVLYNTIITACGLSAKWRQATSLFQELQDIGGTISVVSYGALLISYEKARKWRKAIEIMKNMEEKEGIIPNTIIYNTVIFACASSGAWQTSFDVYRTMRSKGLSTDVTYLAMVQGATEAGGWQQALRIADHMREDGIRPKIEIYNAIMNSCVQTGDWFRALQMLEMMEEEAAAAAQEDGVTTKIVDGSDSSANIVKKAEEGGDNVQADVITYNTGLNACVYIKDWKQAVDIFNRMETRQVKPDLVSYNTLMKVLGDSSKPIAAEEIFRQLQDSEELTPDIISYNTLIKAYGDAGDWVSALDLYRGLRDKEVALLQLLDYACQPDPALEVASDMARSDVEPDGFTLSILAAARSFDTSVIAKVIRVDPDAFEFKDLYNYVEKMITNPDMTHTKTLQNPQILFNALIGATRKDWETARSVMEDMTKYSVSPDAVTFDALINVYVRAGQWAKARKVLREMQAINVTPNALTFSNVINACVSRGQWARTLKELERSRGAYRFNFLAYNVLMAAYSNAGMLDDAIEIYEKMVEVTAPVNVVAYAAFLRGCGRMSQWEDAITIMHHMRESSIKPSPFIQNQLVLGMVYDGALPEAMEVLDLMRQESAPVSPQTFQSVALQLRGLCLLHNIDSISGVAEEQDLEPLTNTRPATYVEALSKKLQARDISEDQCADMASLLEEISLDNPCVAPQDDDLEIWGGEIEQEDVLLEEEEDEISNFVRFVKAGLQ
eukprot:jgi/Bigna1/89959/estExt_fgenesh1_pg.C_590023